MEHNIASLMFTVILCFFAVYPVVQAERLRTVCVAEFKDKFSVNEECIGSLNCTSFECIHKALSNYSSTQVLFLEPEITLSSLVEFYDLSNVSFEGHSGNGSTTVVCNKSIVESGEGAGEGAGLSFTRVENLKITDMIFEFCGGWHSSISTETNSTALSRSSIYIFNSTNVNIVRVVVSRSTGKGLELYDTGGTVEIIDCKFIENKDQYFPGGGGVYVTFMITGNTTETHRECTESVTKSNYRFTNCFFIDNNASLGNISQRSSYHNTERLYQGFGKGGGICIYLNSGARENDFEIKSCYFHNNEAVWAGGLYISYLGNTSNNNITIIDSEFKNNRVKNRGAGGAAVGYSSVRGILPNKNQVLFKNCKFFQNHAVIGGGTSVFTSRKSDSEGSIQNNVRFFECRWIENTARIGSAIDIAPHIWDTLRTGQPIAVPEFRDCNFTRNWCIPDFKTEGHWTTYHQARGTFAATAFSIRFSGLTVFANNNGSSLYLVSSVASFESGTNAVFEGNQGQEGGAIALIGFASLQIKENSNFTFTENRANIRGGAIFHMSIDYHDFLSSRSCFIHYHGNSSKPVDVTFFFDNNTVGLSGYDQARTHYNSIFTTSIYPCFYACHTSNEDKPEITNTFECIGNFTYSPLNNDTIKTSTRRMSFEDITSHVIPGKEFELPFTAYDDFGKEVEDVYQTSSDCIVENCTNPAIKVQNWYIHGKKMKLYGKEYSKGKISLYQNGLPGHVISVDVEMERCPPGFDLLQDLTNLPKCKCSAHMDNTAYQGIHSCKSEKFQANIQKGYWIGYVNKSWSCNTSVVKNQNLELLSAQCPRGFCFPDSTDLKHALPSNSNAALLDDTICGPDRTGILCAQCKKGFSIYFHHYGLSCVKNKLCDIGWLLYILSELLPLTILFTFIVIFNVSFTSGAVNGFILFAQMYDTLDITAHGLIFVKHKRLYRFNKVINSVYRFFNMDFFNSPKLSYCLWRRAGALDILAMKYVSMAYALLLIVIMIVVMNATRLHHICHFLRPQKVRQSVIHGLSAFLVMCYAQCAKVTFKILTPAYLYDSKEIPQRMVSLYDGEIIFFSRGHMLYAIPAVFCLVFVLFLPPLLLMMYPNSHKVLSLLRINESAWFSKVSRFFPVGRMMPLFDSFQSCFKDNVRFFSGLYFIYRVIVLGFSTNTTYTTFYLASSALFSVMIMLHALTQPYVVKWHNTVDTFIFTNLALINCLTLYNYVRIKISTVQETEVDSFFAMQCLLASLPLLYMVVFLLFHPSKYIWSKIHCTKSQDREDNHNELPARLLREDSNSLSEWEYHSYQDSDSGQDVTTM